VQCEAPFAHKVDFSAGVIHITRQTIRSIAPYMLPDYLIWTLQMLNDYKWYQPAQPPISHMASRSCQSAGLSLLATPLCARPPNLDGLRLERVRPATPDLPPSHAPHLGRSGTARLGTDGAWRQKMFTVYGLGRRDFKDNQRVGSGLPEPPSWIGR